MRTKQTTKALGHGDVFGPFSRYQLIHHRSERDGVPSCWMVEDAETVDELCGLPAVIRQAETPEEAVAGLL